MRLLLDTHVILWQVLGTRTLGPEATRALERAEAVYLSVVSFAEIGIKVATGKLEVPDDFEQIVLEREVRSLPLEPSHGAAVGRLPVHHRDPFDRLLIVQAQQASLTLMSSDARFPAYDIALLDPTR